MDTGNNMMMSANNNGMLNTGIVHPDSKEFMFLT